jgi:MtN3 and saliva related transmembrane protein
MDRAGTPLMLNISPLITEWIGYTAAALTTFSFAPQAWLTYKTKDVRGVSLGMYSVLSVGLFLWLLYGLSLNAWPVVAANTVTLMLTFAILAMKLRYGILRTA